MVRDGLEPPLIRGIFGESSATLRRTKHSPYSNLAGCSICRLSVPAIFYLPFFAKLVGYLPKESLLSSKRMTMFFPKNNYLHFTPRATPYEATHIKPIYDSLNTCACARLPVGIQAYVSGRTHNAPTIGCPASHVCVCARACDIYQ